MSAPKRLKLDRYADVLAHLAHLREPTEEILERLGIDLAVWGAAEKEFGVALSNAARHGQRDLATTFASAFSRTRRRLIEEKVTFESLPPAIVDRKPPPDPTEQKSVVGQPSYLVENRLKQAAAAYPLAPPPAASPSAAPPIQPPAPEASAVPNFTIMQAGPMVQDSETLPFMPAPKELVRPASAVADYVPTGTTAPSSESPMSLPFVAQRAAKEETKLKPEQIDLSLFPLELYAEISGGLARGEDRAKLLASRGLTDSIFDVLAQAWAKKLGSDAALMGRFKELARQAATAGKRAT